MKGWKWKGVQFRPTENVQSQFALSYLLIIAAVLILLNTYPLLACQTLVFQAKQSILTEAQMIASNLAELGELGESGAGDDVGGRQQLDPHCGHRLRCTAAL